MRRCVALFAMITLLIACGQPATRGDDLSDRPIRIVTTTGMVGDLVQNIGGERVWGKCSDGSGESIRICTKRALAM